MSVQREKSSSWAGLMVSVLLHGIFFAGCLALDASSLAPAVETEISEPSTVTRLTESPSVAKAKS